MGRAVLGAFSERCGAAGAVLFHSLLPSSESQPAFGSRPNDYIQLYHQALTHLESADNAVGRDEVCARERGASCSLVGSELCSVASGSVSTP